MVMVNDSVKDLKRFLKSCPFSDVARLMITRMVLAFILHRGRMSCSQAGGAIRCEAVHRSQVSRFLARPRWKKQRLNDTLRETLLGLESCKDGRFLFIIDATLCGQSGKKTQNTYSTGNRKRRSKKGRRYGKNKHARRSCHSFTFGLLITPSGYRLPFQIPHYTKEYCKVKGLEHRTTAEAAAAADLIRSLPLPQGADVVVLGDTAYDAKAVREACEERGYLWTLFLSQTGPANPERVFSGPTGQRPKLRSRLKDWTKLSTRTIRLLASTGKYAGYRRLSKWRVGPKLKPRVYYAHQEKQDVRSVGRVQLVFSTMKPDLKKASPDDVKILMTNALSMSLSEIIELYSVRWQIELFFKELKSTLGFDQYRFEDFGAVEGWVETCLTTVLYLEWTRARQLNRAGLSEERRRWWRAQRLHGLCEAFRQESESRELKFLSERLKTSGGITRLKRLLLNAVPCEYRAKT